MYKGLCVDSNVVSMSPHARAYELFARRTHLHTNAYAGVHLDRFYIICIQLVSYHYILLDFEAVVRLRTTYLHFFVFLLLFLFIYLSMWGDLCLHVYALLYFNFFCVCISKDILSYLWYFIILNCDQLAYTSLDIYEYKFEE